MNKKQLELLISNIAVTADGENFKVIGTDRTRGAGKQLIGGNMNDLINPLVTAAIDALTELGMEEQVSHPAAETVPILYFYNNSTWFKSSIANGGGGAGSATGAKDLGLTGGEAASDYREYNIVLSSAQSAPAAGIIKVGIDSDGMYMIDSSGTITYIATEDYVKASDKALSYGTSTTEIFKDLVIADGGTWYPNTISYEIAKLKQADILVNTKFALFPGADKATVVYGAKPFTAGQGAVDRNSVKNLVNSDGYIEPVAAHILGVDYSDGYGVIRTDPQRTNLITYPKSLGNSYWTKSGATIEGDASTAGADMNVSNCITSPIPYTTFSGASPTGFSATSDGTSTQVASTAAEIAVTTGGAILVTFDLTLNSGTAPEIGIYTNYAGSNIGTNLWTPVNGTNTLWFYGTSDLATAILRFKNASTTTDYVVSNLSVATATGYSTLLLDSGTPTTEAYKLVEDGTTGSHNINKTSISITSGAIVSYSFYAKSGERSKVQLYNFVGGGFTNGADFDLSTGVVSNNVNGAGSMTIMSDGWYRCTFTSVALTGQTTTNFAIRILNDAGSSSYTGDGTSGVYLCYPQLEEGDYVSPLMLPATEGSTTTRLADAVTGFGDAATFSSVNSSGAMIVRMAAQTSDVSEGGIYLDDVTSANRIQIFYSGATASNQLRATLTVASSTTGFTSTILSDATDVVNIGFYWDTDDFALYVNGTEVATDVSGATFGANVLDNVRIIAGSTIDYAIIGNFTKQQIIDYTTP